VAPDDTLLLRSSLKAVEADPKEAKAPVREAAKANALAVKARADTILTVAKAEQARAETEAIMVNMDGTQQDQVLKAAEAAIKNASLGE